MYNTSPKHVFVWGHVYIHTLCLGHVYDLPEICIKYVYTYAHHVYNMSNSGLTHANTNRTNVYNMHKTFLKCIQHV